MTQISCDFDEQEIQHFGSQLKVLKDTGIDTFGIWQNTNECTRCTYQIQEVVKC